MRGRAKQLMKVDHKFDTRLITLNEDLINIRSKIATQPRLSKMEDELRDVKVNSRYLILQHRFYTYLPTYSLYVFHGTRIKIPGSNQHTINVK